MRYPYRDARLYLHPHPQVVSTAVPFQARVTTTVRSAMSLTLTEVTGTWPRVESLVYVGPVGDRFRYISRVRSTAPPSTIGIAENEVPFDGTFYLYAPHLYTVLPKFQRVQDVSGTPTVWKDFDLTPVPLPPKVNITGPFVTSVNAPTVFTVNVLNMERDATGGSFTVSTDGNVTIQGNSVTIRWTTPGFRWIHVTGSDSAGSNIAVHPVFVDTVSFPAHIVNAEGTNNDGWTTQVEVYDILPEAMPMAGYLQPILLGVLKVGDDYFLGWAFERDVSHDVKARKTTINLHTSLKLTDRIRSHSFYLEDASRSSWYTLPGLNIRRAAHLLLQFHSTFNAVTPVTYEEPWSSYPIKSQKFQDGSLLSQLNGDLLEDGLLIPSQRRSGPVVVTRPPNWRWSRTGVPVVSVRPSEVRLTERKNIGQLKAGGFAYDTPLLSAAPGNCPDLWRGVEEKQGLIVTSQTDINQISGLLLADKNAPEVSVSLVDDRILEAVGGYYFSISGFSERVEPRSVRAEAQAGCLVLECSGVMETRPVEGETVIVPQEPAPSPPEFPVPEPPLPPPSAPSGLALVRTRYLIMRTLNVYSQSPVWTPVFDVRNWSGSDIVDFRYVEGRGASGVSVVVLAKNGGLYWTPDIAASPVTWHQLLTPAQVRSIIGLLNPECTHLMTLVQSSSYIGFTLTAHAENYQHHTLYVYTRNWGQSWSVSTIRPNTGGYRSSVRAIFNTAGTEEIGVFTGTGIFGTSTFFFRSLNGGASWTQVATYGTAETEFKVVKPWQWGTSGGRLYATGRLYGFHWRGARSLNNGSSFSETVPGAAEYNSVRYGIEYWTHDPYLVCAVLDWTPGGTMRFLRSADGMSSWSVISTVPILQQAPPIARLSGNPANKNEWTVLSIWDNRTSGVYLAQSLDRGLTWSSLMGNWYSAHPDGRWDGQDYLIIPPFRVVKQREP